MAHRGDLRERRGAFAARLALLAAMCSVSMDTDAQSSPFVGEWMLEITQGGAVQTGLLSIEATDAGLAGFLQNGPIVLLVDGNEISMAIDSRNASGAPLERNFEGRLTGDGMSGEFGPPATATEEELLVCERFPGGCIHPSGTWRAVRHAPVRPDSMEPRPVDISGRWGMTAGSGMLKWSSSLTAAGQAWNDAFDVDLDLPSLRCANQGVFWRHRSAPEIFQQDDKITFATNSGVRHIYLDGREPPEFLPHSAMGFSSGRWEGDHLVVETTLLSAGVKGYMGEVYSENSRMLERYWLNADGTLSGEMELHDPENFLRPPLQWIRWARQSADTVPITAECDVDSFFRQIFVDGRMQEYIERSDRRF